MKCKFKNQFRPKIEIGRKKFLFVGNNIRGHVGQKINWKKMKRY